MPCQTSNAFNLATLLKKYLLVEVLGSVKPDAHRTSAYTTLGPICKLSVPPHAQPSVPIAIDDARDESFWSPFFSKALISAPALAPRSYMSAALIK